MDDFVCPKCRYREKINVIYIDLIRGLLMDDSDKYHREYMFWSDLNNQFKEPYETDFLGCSCKRCGYDWIEECYN